LSEIFSNAEGAPLLKYAEWTEQYVSLFGYELKIDLNVQLGRYRETLGSFNQHLIILSNYQMQLNYDEASIRSVADR